MYVNVPFLTLERRWPPKRVIVKHEFFMCHDVVTVG